MAKHPCKGAVLQAVIAEGVGVLAPVGQVMSIDVEPAETETFEDRDLAQTGPAISTSPTGYSEPGAVNFEAFFDPNLPSQMIFQDMIADPVLASGETALIEGAIVYPTAVNKTASFESNGITFGHGLKMNEGMKMNVGLKLRDIMTFA